ncbi:MAG: TldD/PmbA family protein [Acholeplasmatales bacterium]|nr:TldD/PmbA family protein [Acholeplasmatales bacterium]MDY4016785.1 TldD/PmbA family protein [Bacilli bacterium]
MSIIHKEMFGINETLAKEILEVALSTGGDFAEVYMEKTTNEVLRLHSGKLSTANVSKVKGAAIRIIKGELEVNSSITDCTYENLLKAAKTLAGSFNDKKHVEVQPFVEKKVELVVNPKNVRGNDISREVNLLKTASDTIYAYSKEIVQVICNLTKTEKRIFVFASDSTWQTDYRCNTRLSCQAVASDGKEMETGFDSFGRNQGMEMFDDFDVVPFAKQVAHDAVEMLHAEPMQGGEMPVVINNGFGGVILHEACVHGLEATSVAKGMSVFCNKLGQKVASDIVNAVDDGTNLNAWGSINVDDEGTPSKCNVLIENGILKSYLVDKRNSKKMNHPITGSSRRESYKYQTTSRMTNTYFLNGKSTFDEIIKSTEKGLFAEKMGGGSVNPATGEFNFAVQVGYMIENGKITKPVKGATLVGSGKDVLLHIDMIGDNLSCGYGMCGSMSGSVPTIVGQPTIRVSKMTVGGKGGNN